VPILLAPAESWRALRALGALLGAFGPQWGCNVQALNLKL